MFKPIHVEIICYDKSVIFEEWELVQDGHRFMLDCRDEVADKPAYPIFGIAALRLWAAVKSGKFLTRAQLNTALLFGADAIYEVIPF